MIKNEENFVNVVGSQFEILLGYLENGLRNGTRDTPKRVGKAWWELFSGYRTGDDQIKEMLTIFDGNSYDEMVVLRDIEFTSFCEHHILPFMGVAHVGYVPGGRPSRVVGISKLARLVDVFARRLQIQEALCTDVVQALKKHLDPLGAACVIEAKHLCISCRGIQKQHSVMVTSAMVGCFKDDLNTRQEFMRLIGK